MYSALTNKRVYRHEKYIPEEAYEIIKNDCNKNKLDKDVVAALHKAIMDKEEN
jgi:HD-GYP domain-containing protein (c-di-GMP phosphodiesterase class II)